MSDTGLFVHVQIRKGSGPDSTLIAHGQTRLKDDVSLDYDVREAVEILRRELADRGLRHEIAMSAPGAS